MRLDCVVHDFVCVVRSEKQNINIVSVSSPELDRGKEGKAGQSFERGKEG